MLSTTAGVIIYSRCAIGDAMKKILLILVGGTICTGVDEDGILSVREDAGARIVNSFLESDSFACDEASFDLSDNLFTLSENITKDSFNQMIDTYRKHIKREAYDGVIFLHGTDTLAYTASLFSIILANTKIPVFFVSANKRPDLAESNGNENFKAAVECICRGIPENVYAVYKNITDGKMYLHLASRLLQCQNYSDDFYSVDAIDITDINDGSCKTYFDNLRKKYPKEKKKVFFDICGDWHITADILLIMPYVNIDYSAYDYKKFSAVLHGTYHAGTACMGAKNEKNTISYLIDKCDEYGVDMYFSPAKKTGEMYETAHFIKNHTAKNGAKIKFLYGATNETTYAKLQLAYSVCDKSDIEEFLNTECNFEFIDS